MKLTQPAILQFSGGKDSTALLYLARDCLDQVEVCFVNTGGAVPEVSDFVEETCRKLGARLTVIRPKQDVERFTQQHGLPVDLVPAWSERHFAWLNREAPRQLFQSPMSCCGEMLWRPMRDHVLRSRRKLVLRGAKFVDKHRGVSPGFIDGDGIRYEAPIWGWTNEAVFAYLKQNDVTLPRHYAEFTDSFDCWCCTAYLTTDYGARKIAYMKREYPERWPALRERLTAVRAAISSEAATINAAIDGVI